MVGGRRLWRPPARFHRSIDDLFDTIFRLASKDRVNEVHLKFVGKFDTYHSSDGRRSETPVLFELRPPQQGHLVFFLGGNLAVSASGTMFRGGFEDVKTMCQLSKMLEKQWTNCQGQVKVYRSSCVLMNKESAVSFFQFIPDRPEEKGIIFRRCI